MTRKPPSPSVMIRLVEAHSPTLAAMRWQQRNYLIGRITEVMGDCVNVIASRPEGSGARRVVETDDIARALLRFANGATGSSGSLITLS